MLQVSSQLQPCILLAAVVGDTTHLVRCRHCIGTRCMKYFMACLPLVKSKNGKLVSLGAGSGLSPRVKKVYRFSGKISYPLYMTHYAAIWVFGNYFTTKKPAAGELTFIIILGVIFLVVIAYLVMVFYDVPVRKYLAKKRREGLRH